MDAETDQLRSHVVENRPKDNEDDVPLGTTISVHFDRDVKSVNINKLFEVSQLFASANEISQLGSHAL